MQKQTLFIIVQIKKDEIKNKILEVARTEFQEKGFANASMRKIAKKAGISVSNIYNYFKRKDEIFKEIIYPTIYLTDQLINRYLLNEGNYKNIEKWTVESSWQQAQAAMANGLQCATHIRDMNGDVASVAYLNGNYACCQSQSI